MDLVHQVAANLEIEAGKPRGIAPFSCAAHEPGWRHIRQGEARAPQQREPDGRALMGAARTGERRPSSVPGLLRRSPPRAIRKTTSRAWGAWCSSTCGPLSGGRSWRSSCERTDAAVDRPASPPQSRQPTCRNHSAIPSRAKSSRRARSRAPFRAVSAASTVRVTGHALGHLE